MVGVGGGGVGGLLTLRGSQGPSCVFDCSSDGGEGIAAGEAIIFMLLPGGKTWLLCCVVRRIMKHHRVIRQNKGLERPRGTRMGLALPHPAFSCSEVLRVVCA